MAFVINPRLLVMHSACREVRFHADDRLYPHFFCFLVEFYCSVEVPMIGECESRETQFAGSFHKLVDFSKAIKETVMAMCMEMHEGHARIVTESLAFSERFHNLIDVSRHDFFDIVPVFFDPVIGDTVLENIVGSDFL